MSDDKRITRDENAPLNCNTISEAVSEGMELFWLNQQGYLRNGLQRLLAAVLAKTDVGIEIRRINGELRLCFLLQDDNNEYHSIYTVSLTEVLQEWVIAHPERDSAGVQRFKEYLESQVRFCESYQEGD